MKTYSGKIKQFFRNTFSHRKNREIKKPTSINKNCNNENDELFIKEIEKVINKTESYW
ncbi:hypothetical protein [Bacteroides sp. 519]|uniref:hypothetical protein n=1 Tax=Bacteroides sp. 519 TaxID=2302937 RepID=UPI0013D03E85|nr:hypothetical protein [Bacteroides sp. 519]